MSNDTIASEARGIPNNVIKTKFSPGELVVHVTDKGGAVGIITAFMVRGTTHSYEVQWGTSKSGWHIELELEEQEGQEQPTIGFGQL